jgi:hypothetical protein
MIHPGEIKMEKKQVKNYQADPNASEKTYYEYEIPKIMGKFDTKIKPSNGDETSTRTAGTLYCKYETPSYVNYQLEKKKDLDSDSDSGDNVTITSQQLDIVKKFMKVCGFNGLMDYHTKISAKDITNEILIELNKLASKIDSLFPIHEINLRRTGLKFTTATLVMSVLRNLLTYVGIRWKSYRNKKGIFISIVSDEICEYDRTCIEHLEYVKKCDDCEALKFSVKCKNIAKTHDKTYYLFLDSSSFGWMKLDIKKLKITNLPKEMKGLYYHIFIGCRHVFTGTLDNKNLFPTKYIPFSKMGFHCVHIIIYCDKFNPTNIMLTFDLTPYIDNNRIPIDNVLCLPWFAKTNNILRIISGMGGLSKTPDDFYIEYSKHVDNKKVLDLKNAEKISFPNPYWKNCDTNTDHYMDNFKLKHHDMYDIVDEIVYYYQFTTTDTKYKIYLDSNFIYYSISSLQLMNDPQKHAKFTYYFINADETKKKHDYDKNESFNFMTIIDKDPIVHKCLYIKVSNLEKNKQYTLKVNQKISSDH